MKKYLITVTVLLLASEAGGSPCAQYEPARTELTGTLIARDYPGPPNFESIESGDQRLLAWILVLDSRLCVAGDPTSDINSEEVEGETEVQLVPSADLPTFAPFQRRALQVSGTLFAAHSGYHQTAVLMKVESLGAQGSRPEPLLK